MVLSRDCYSTTGCIDRSPYFRTILEYVKARHSLWSKLHWSHLMLVYFIQLLSNFKRTWQSGVWENWITSSRNWVLKCITQQFSLLQSDYVFKHLIVFSRFFVTLKLLIDVRNLWKIMDSLFNSYTTEDKQYSVSFMFSTVQLGLKWTSKKI